MYDNNATHLISVFTLDILSNVNLLLKNKPGLTIWPFYTVASELPNDLRLKILGNKEILGKS